MNQLLLGLGKVVLVGTVIGLADLALYMVGGEHLEIWVWRLFACIYLSALINRLSDRNAPKGSDRECVR
jgi:hypothetical protein